MSRWETNNILVVNFASLVIPPPSDKHKVAVLRKYLYNESAPAICERFLSKSKLYFIGFQTFLSAGTGNQLNEFRGTPALESIPIDVE